MSKLTLSLGISYYDHVADLIGGRVRPEGIDLQCLVFPVEEIFFRFVLHREWDVSELSLGKYSSLISHGDNSLVAIPVFPSRIFRHSSIYVRSGGPIKGPQDLANARVGIPEWAQTATIYCRGLLQHQYGIDLSGIRWFQAGVNEAGRAEKVNLSLPPDIRLTPVPDGTLNDMLLTGVIDAAITAHPPHAFAPGDDSPIKRLLSDSMGLESAYYRETGIFPIMHVIAIQRAVFERHPWVAGNLLTAFEEAKRRSLERALEITASRFPIPWAYEAVSRAREVFGENYWPYGLDSNRKTLDSFLQFAFEQGVCRKRLTPDDLFPPQVAHTYKI